MNFKSVLEKNEIKASVPCRIDLGGTLDLSTFFLPLGHLNPATFNIALDMRTTVTLSPWKENRIKISSKGFDSAEFEAENVPFKHPMGLMFAVVRYFNGHGVHVHIDSTSPPRSALGGSSSATVAMIAAFSKALELMKESAESLNKYPGHDNSRHDNSEHDNSEHNNSEHNNSEHNKTPGYPINPSDVALLAHYIESSVAGVPCGLQDQLAAAHGGVNCWHWKMGSRGVAFTRENLMDMDHGESHIHRDNKMDNKMDNKDDMNRNILVAYCGIPHVSSDINKRWVNRFLSGQDRDKWRGIIKITRDFVSAVKARDFNGAACFMNRETLIRIKMTPDVLDHTGNLLFDSAVANGCGARFTGAGGGGCLWAMGDMEKITKLKVDWQTITENTPQAGLLNTAIDYRGIL